MDARKVDAQTEWRGQLDTSTKRLLVWLVVSLLLHAFTPLVGLLGLVRFLGAADEVPPPLPPITAIPIDLLSADDPAGGGEPQKTPEPAAKPSDDISLGDPEQPKPKPIAKKPPDDESVDAGPDARELADAMAPTSPDAAVAPADAGVPGPGRSIGDPVAMSGAGKVADANANVRLIVYTERIRNHPLGPRIGKLLSSAYQWRDFFGPTSLDPIRDIDRILIAGPQLRDSSEVVAVLKHNVGEAQIRKAVDVLVQRDPSGGWLDGGVPAASARADRAARVFVLPTKDLVIVSPPSAAAHAMKYGASMRFPPAKGAEVVTVYLVTPWRVFIGLPFRLEKSIKWARLELVPTPDGGAVAHIEAEDESPEAARRNAEQLERAARAASELQLGIFGALLGTQKTKFVDEIVFEAKGSRIHGRITANGKQLASLLEMVSAFAKQLSERSRPRATSSAENAPPTPPAPAPATD